MRDSWMKKKTEFKMNEKTVSDCSYVFLAKLLEYRNNVGKHVEIRLQTMT